MKIIRVEVQSIWVGRLVDEKVRQMGAKWGGSFKGEERYFEADAMFNGRPVKRLQNRSDVFTGPGVSKGSSEPFGGIARKCHRGGNCNSQGWRG